MEPLPPGWFYNGVQYLDMGGEKRDTHPSLDEFIQQYVDNENEQRQTYNNDIDKMDYHDLFE